MCTGISVTRWYVLRSQQTNKAGSKIDAYMVVTMETLSAFLRSQGDFQKDCFLKDGLAEYDVSVGWLFVVSTFNSIFPSKSLIKYGLLYGYGFFQFHFCQPTDAQVNDVGMCEISAHESNQIRKSWTHQYFYLPSFLTVNFPSPLGPFQQLLCLYFRPSPNSSPSQPTGWDCCQNCGHPSASQQSGKHPLHRPHPDALPCPRRVPLWFPWVHDSLLQMLTENIQ